MFALLGRDSESLNERNFSRILRDAHDSSVVDIRKRGDSFDVAPAASAPPVTEQLAKADGAKVPAAAGAPKQRSITGRRPGRSKIAAPPADLLSVGVVEVEKPAARAATKSAAPAKPAAKKTARKRVTKKKAAKRASE
jgi:hypothetical protein